MILTKIAEALRDDEALNSWCADNLGKLPNILVGIDELNPPDMEKYPLIAISDIETKGEGMGSDKVIYSVPISCGIRCDEKVISDRMEIFKGMILVEEFRVKVAESLMSKVKKTQAIVTVSANAMSITAHPLYVSTMAADFKTLK